MTVAAHLSLDLGEGLAEPGGNRIVAGRPSRLDGYLTARGNGIRAPDKGAGVSA